MFDLSGKVALVTGGASGIGRAAAERFAAAGALVVVADLTDASAFAASIDGAYVRADISIEDDVQALMLRACELRGRIDICINNAGITVAETAIADTRGDDIRRALAVNTLGAFHGLKYAPAHMPDGGTIINTASIAAVVGFPTYAAYAASKAAIVSLTRTAAIELGPRGIRVNAICPTSVDTPMLASQPNGELEAAISRQASPLGTIVAPEEVAALMHFLAADDSRTITGQAINIDGGLTAGISIGIIEALVMGLTTG